MPFDRTRVQRVAGAAYQNLWLYNTPDTIATVTASGYFSAMADELNRADIIMVVSETGGTIKIDNIAVTTSRSATPTATTATEGVTVS